MTDWTDPSIDPLERYGMWVDSKWHGHVKSEMLQPLTHALAAEVRRLRGRLAEAPHEETCRLHLPRSALMGKCDCARSRDAWRPPA